MRQLAYISSSAMPQTSDFLSDIALISHVNNRAEDVSGILFANGGWFFQVLEGEAEAVERTYRRIGEDLRHLGITTILDEEVDRRAFDTDPLLLTLLGEPESSMLLSRLFDGVRDVLADHVQDGGDFEARLFARLAARGIGRG